jgi:hypothetical protein
VLPPRTPEEGYHLSEDLADDAIFGLHRHLAFERHLVAMTSVECVLARCGWSRGTTH